MKRMITQKDIEKLAELGRIELAESEKKELTSDIESILEYISQIQEVVSGEVVSEAGAHRNVMREDIEPHEKGMFTESLLSAAPKREGNYVKVKKILHQD